MRIGLSTPVVVQFPGVCSDWEQGGGIDDLVSIAVTADELGFDHITCSEHVAVPVDLADQRGATYWDPVAVLAYHAACTRQIRLATSVVVLGYHPLEHALQDRVPIWVEGRSLRSLRRALDCADGWTPFGLSARALGDMLAAADLPGDFEVALAPSWPLDPLGDPGGTRGRLRALREAGATVVTAAVSAESCGHYCDQLGALRKHADTIS